MPFPGALTGLPEGKALDQRNGRLNAWTKSAPALLPPRPEGARDAVALNLAVAVVQDMDVLPALQPLPQAVEHLGLVFGDAHAESPRDPGRRLGFGAAVVFAANR